MNTCPYCKRALLSHSSARCNWCGKVIEDAAYQAKAEVEREASIARQAQHDAQSLANIEAININGYNGFYPVGMGYIPFMGSPSFNQRMPIPGFNQGTPGVPHHNPTYDSPQAAGSVPPQAASELAQAASPNPPPENSAGELPEQSAEADSDARFRHLEL